MEDLFDFVNKMQKFSNFANQLNSASDLAASLAMNRNYMNSVKDLTGMSAINKIVSFPNQFIPKIYKSHVVDTFAMIRSNTLTINQNRLLDSMQHITQVQNNIIDGFSNIERICNIHKKFSGVSELLGNLNRSLDSLKYTASYTEDIEEMETLAEVYQMIDVLMPLTIDSNYVTKEDLEKFKSDFMEFFETQNIQKKKTPRTFDEYIMLIGALFAIVDYFIKAINSIVK